jgi:multidrug efflux pump subunit AcrB
MSAITRFSLDTSRVTIVFLIMLVLYGVYQFTIFPRQEDPPITIREVVISAVFPGMEPADMEELIARPIEAQMRTLPEIDEIWSESKTGKVLIHADVRDQYSDLTAIWQKVRNKMADLKPQLPQGTVGPFVNDEFGLTAVATIALWSDGFSMAEMRVTARDVRDRLYELEGIRKVELYGVQDERVYLKYSPTKLAQYGVNIGEIADTIIAQNVVLSGGKINAAGKYIIIEPSGNFEKPEDIAAVPIRIPNTDKTLRLGDVVSVEKTYLDPPTDMAYFKGKQSIVISVSIIPGVNSVEFGERLKAKVQDLEAELPFGYFMEFATFQPELVQRAVDGAMSNVYQTLIIVSIVVILFLGLRTGLIVGSFVPATMLMGLIIMGFFDVELERVSIASAIIALGMLVDNGIVVAEDIRSRMELGASARDAGMASGGTLAIPLLTSSLTTIFAFMPMLLIDGGTGDYVYSLPVVITVLLLSSWFLSMYQTPSMCRWFMKVNVKSGDDQDPYSGRTYQVYKGFLAKILGMKPVVVLFAVGMLVFGGFVASRLVQEFFGASDRNQILVYYDLPAGSSIHASRDVTEKLTAWANDREIHPDVTGTIAYIGTGGPRFFLSLSPPDPDPHRGFMIIDTRTAEDVPAVADRFRDYFSDALPEATARVKPMWMGGNEPGIMKIRFFSQDLSTLFNVGEAFTDQSMKIPGVKNIYNDWENKVLKINVIVDQARARRAGVSSQDVATSLEAHIDGVQVSEYREEDLAIPLVFRADDEQRDHFGDLWNINIFSTSTGMYVPISQIAEFRHEWEYSKIARRNQVPCLTVEMNHQYLKAPQLFELLKPILADPIYSSGVSWELDGEMKESAKTTGYLMENMPPCLFGIVLLIIWQFNSFRRAFIILFTIPLAFVGAFIGLFILQAPFDFMSILGLFSLAGVIINNGIVLIDRIEGERKDGKDAHQAVMDASVSRLRPIVMTTVTTLLGVMPLIISKDPLFYSMSIVLGSGLLFGTMLTLGVAPTMYELLMRVSASPTKTEAR